MAASLDDILTAAKNLVVAVNGVATQIARGQGQVTSDTVEADTLIFRGSGRLVNLVVIDGGSADGMIYDANSVGTAANPGRMFVIPQTEGRYEVGQAFTAGLVITVGTGQKVNVTYSVNGQ